MTATARAAANAGNAPLSTGPRTEEGKARVSRNAVKHGLTSKQLVIAPGEEEEFAELHDALHQQLAPADALEMSLFNMIVHAAWNIERFRTLEAQLMSNGLDDLLDDLTTKTLDRLQRYATANKRSYLSALRELRTVQNNRLLLRTVEGHKDPLPELVSVVEITKQTQRLEASAQVERWIAKVSLCKLFGVEVCTLFGVFFENGRVGGAYGSGLKARS